MYEAYEEFYQYAKMIRRCDELPQLNVICQQYLSLLQLKYFQYTWQPVTDCGIENKMLLSYYPNEWKNQQAIDTKVYIDTDNPQPIEWDKKQIAQQSMSNKVLDSFWQQPLTINSAGGIIIPIHGMFNSKAIFCAFRQNPKPKQQIGILPLLENWAMQVHHQVEKIYSNQHVNKPITIREQQVLEMIVAGKTNAEIAKIIHVSVATVNFHIKNLRTKFNANNKHHLITKALTLNFASNCIKEPKFTLRPL